MANFDKQYLLLTRELKEIIREELEKQMADQQSIFLLRQVGVEEFMYRSSRSREIQHVESLINRLEIILDKTGILREDCILSVLDAYRAFFDETDFMKRKKRKAKHKEYSLEERTLALLEHF